MANIVYLKLKEDIAELNKKYIELANEINEDIDISESIEQYEENLKVYQDKNKLEISFLGQYSAGKSSLISALTENQEIAIGQNITTSEVKTYEWKNILLTDTPGIGTENQEHDEMSLRHINTSDLLIYVVTVQGFDDYIAKDFKRIAFDEDKIGKMMLVVNKKSMESEENQPYWEKHISEVIVPSNLDELYVTFTDAENYLDALTFDEPEFKEGLIELSNINKLKKNINIFISKKGIDGKLISELNIIEDSVRSIIKKLDELNFDYDQELLKRREFIMKARKKKFNELVNNEMEDLIAKIDTEFSEFLGKLNEESEIETINSDSDEAIKIINNLISDGNSQLKYLLQEEINGMLSEFKDIFNNETYEETFGFYEIENIGTIDKLDDIKKIDTEKLPEHLKTFGKYLGAAGETVKRFAGTDKGVSGSQVHKGILKAGHTLGKKFRPYEAVNITKNINKTANAASKAGPAIQVINSVATPAIALYEENTKKKKEEFIKEYKYKQENWINERNKSIAEGHMEWKNDVLKDLYDSEIENIQSSLELIEMRKSRIKISHSSLNNLHNELNMCFEKIRDTNLLIED